MWSWWCNGGYMLESVHSSGSCFSLQKERKISEKWKMWKVCQLSLKCIAYLNLRSFSLKILAHHWYWLLKLKIIRPEYFYWHLSTNQPKWGVCAELLCCDAIKETGFGNSYLLKLFLFMEIVKSPIIFKKQKIILQKKISKANFLGIFWVFSFSPF